MFGVRGIIALLLLSLLVALAGCADGGGAALAMPRGVPVIRVRLMQDCKQVVVAGTEPVWVKSAQDINSQRVNFPRVGSLVKLTNGTWMAGGINLGSGELYLTPSTQGAMTVQGRQYRGRYRFVPLTPNTFDVVNDVDIDGYLKSVVSRELYPNWEDQTYCAQAVVARTYAIYEAKTAGMKRYWDVFPDQRSQVYGGVASETSKSIRAVDATAGMVVAYGPKGQERIFKAYFSSCCGGKSQSAYDCFGDEYSQPLSERTGRTWCGNSGKFNWPTVTIRKDEIARRISVWAKYKTEQLGTVRPETRMAGVSRIDLAFTNKITGRPAFFQVTDTQGNHFIMRAEELRLAIAYDVPRGGATLWSSNFVPLNDTDAIRFTDGHGYGHGVGMCQWCAQSQAQAGWQYQNIVTDAFPGSKLIKAY